MLSLIFSAMQFTEPVLIFPLVAGILGIKADKGAFFIALWLTLGTFAMAIAYLPSEEKHLAVLVSIIAKGISFLGIQGVLQNRKQQP